MWWRQAGLLAGVLCFAGCGSESKTAVDATDECGPADDVEQGANTAVEGAKTGGTTAWEGTKTFGKSVGGFVEGGSGEAKQEWNEGKEQTRQTARQGSAKTKEAARTRPCR